MTIVDRLHHRATMVATVVAALLLSCTYDNSEKCEERSVDDKEQDKAFISLNITVDGAVSTRADGDSGDGTTHTGNPAGSEDGNGREPGQGEESKIKNATVFLVSTSDLKLNADLTPTTNGFDESSLSATIADAYYFSQFTTETSTTGGTTEETVYKSESKQCPLKIRGGAKYYALVVVNMGDMANKYIGKTLESLLQDKVETPCDNLFDPTNAATFKMASILPATLTNQKGSGTKADPYVVDVIVERLAARIDFDPNATYDEALKGFCYNLINKEGTAPSGEGFVLKSVIPFNLASSTMGERPFKTVLSGDEAPTLAYVMQEAYGTDDKATNYVADAAYGATRSLDRYDVFDKYGDVDLTKITDDEISAFATKAPDRTYTDDATSKYYILGYPMENVPLDNLTTSVTGILLYGDYYYGSNNWDTATKQPKEKAESEKKAYVYYIRHCNPDETDEPADGDKMYYGIVRNNIYRLKMKSITTEKTEVNIVLKVIEWKHKKHSKIYI